MLGGASTGSLISTRVLRLSSGAICGVWALWNWLTVIPGADVLAEAISVQKLLQNPNWVLTYPGQNYGGTIEYPFLILSEWIFPHNPYALTLWRVLFAFLIGFLAAALFSKLFPQGRRWIFLLAVAAGPAVLHGRTGPAENEVGSIWLNSIYPFSWLLALLGAYLILNSFNQDANRSKRASVVRLLGGTLVGLGIYEQPTTFLLALALLALVLFRTRGSFRQWIFASVGIAVGLVPMLLAAGPMKSVTTGTPAHFPTPTVHTAFRALGLTGEDDSFNSVLPNSLGLSAGESLVGGFVNQLLLCLWLTLIAIGLVYSIIARRTSDTSVIRALSVSWLLVILGIVALDSVMETVWFYGAGLSVLLWISLGALSALNPKWLTLTFCLGYVAVLFVASLGHSQGHLRAIGSETVAKHNVVAAAVRDSQSLTEARIQYVFGSYLDVISIGYYSSGSIRAISNHYDRFPLTPLEKSGGSIVVAVNSTPSDPWGVEALEKVENSCSPLNREVILTSGSYRSFRCPVEIIGMN